VDRGQSIKRTIGERIRESVEIGQDVGAAGGIPVQPDRSGLLVNPAADVQDPQLLAVLRHSSRVSSANQSASDATSLPPIVPVICARTLPVASTTSTRYPPLKGSAVFVQLDRRDHFLLGHRGHHDQQEQDG